jgi:hypothetical protein
MYWACSYINMFYFMAGSAFTQGLYRLNYDVLYPKVITISGFLEYKLTIPSMLVSYCAL